MNVLSVHKIHRLLLSAILLAPVAPLAAKDATDSKPSAVAAAVSAQMISGEAARAQMISPPAQAVIDRMTSYLQSLTVYSIEAISSRDEVVEFGYRLQNNEVSTLVVQKPDKLRAEISGDIRNRTMVYDGAKLTLFSPDDAVFSTTKAPDSLAALIGGLLDAGVELPGIDVLYQANNGTLTADVRGGLLIGESTIDGVVCDHLAFRQATLDWQIWVEKGDRPLPRRIVIADRFEFGNPQYQTTMHWNLQPKIDSSTFVFTAPHGVTEIPFQGPALIADVTPAGDK